MQRNTSRPLIELLTAEAVLVDANLYWSIWEHLVLDVQLLNLLTLFCLGVRR